MLLGVDVGGTFTDAVVFDGERLYTAKAPTTPDDQSRGVLDAVEAALAEAGAEAGDVESFAHGMTVGTNALLEQRGARTALVATRGLRRPARDRPPEPPAPLSPLRPHADPARGAGGPDRGRASGSGPTG